jgi:hypothetical protein
MASHEQLPAQTGSHIDRVGDIRISRRNRRKTWSGRPRDTRAACAQPTFGAPTPLFSP